MVSVEGNSTSISSEHVAAAVNVLDLVVYYEEKMQRQTATASELTIQNGHVDTKLRHCLVSKNFPTVSVTSNLQTHA